MESCEKQDKQAYINLSTEKKAITNVGPSKETIKSEQLKKNTQNDAIVDPETEIIPNPVPSYPKTISVYSKHVLPEKGYETS